MDRLVHIEYGAGNYGYNEGVDPNKQFAVLFGTVKQLFESNKGVFLVNDLNRDWAEYAADVLKYFIRRENYDIEVRSLPGDYTEMELPETDTAHLKHQEATVYLPSNNPVYFLRRMAEQSKTGLEVTIWEHEKYLFEEMWRYGLRFEVKEGGFPYVLPNANWTDKGYNNMRLIIPQSVQKRFTNPWQYGLPPFLS